MLPFVGSSVPRIRRAGGNQPGKQPGKEDIEEVEERDAQERVRWVALETARNETVRKAKYKMERG